MRSAVIGRGAGGWRFTAIPLSKSTDAACLKLGEHSNGKEAPAHFHAANGGCGVRMGGLLDEEAVPTHV